MLTARPLAQLRNVPRIKSGARAALPSPTRGAASVWGRPKLRFLGLLPLWEKVAEGRMRGRAVSTLAGATLLLLPATTAAQEAGWHYSPYPNEGDRAALGCSYGATPERHTCIAVRCEDDFSVGLHLDTTRLGGDAGRWGVAIDDEDFEVTAARVDGSPYGAKVDGDVSGIIEAIKNGVSLFLDPMDGAQVSSSGIGLSGSLYAINQALFFCAPRVDPESEDQGSDGA